MLGLRIERILHCRTPLSAHRENNHPQAPQILHRRDAVFLRRILTGGKSGGAQEFVKLLWHEKKKKPPTF